MNGKQIYHSFLKDRDFKGSEKDCYALELEMIFLSIGEQLFELLEQAKKENKLLNIKKDSIFNDFISIEDLEIV